MQYGNPYFAQPFQQIQPYQDRLAQLQNSYQQAMPYGQAQIQQPIQQMPQVPQIPMLQGQMVDGIDTVKAKDVDMSGNPVYYPKTDGTEIYRKQLQADGRSRIFVYRLINPEELYLVNQSNLRRRKYERISPSKAKGILVTNIRKNRRIRPH